MEPEDELVLPADDELDQSRRDKQKVELPERSRNSPLLRRVIMGDARGKGDGSEAGERKSRRGGVVRREIGTKSQLAAARKRDADESTPVAPARPEEDLDPSPKPGWMTGPWRGTGVPVAPPDGEEADGDGQGMAAEGAPPTSADGPRRRRRKRTVVTLEDQEAEWQQARRSPVWWLGGGVLCLLVVGIAVSVTVMRGGFGKPAPTPPRRADAFVSETPFESLPIAEFVAQSAELLPVVREIITKVESGEGGPELVRGGTESLERMRAWRSRYPAPAPFRDQGLHEIHASGNNAFAYLIMTGERRDFSPLMAYFVKKDDRIQLDWEATEGYSEVLVHEAEILEDGQPRMMRGIVQLSNFYTDVYPENRYRCYTIHHDDPGEWLWAYAEREGAVDFGILGRILQPDPLGQYRKITVKIAKGNEGSRVNQVLLREYLFGGWIAPPVPDAEGVDIQDP